MAVFQRTVCHSPPGRLSPVLFANRARLYSKDQAVRKHHLQTRLGLAKPTSKSPFMPQLWSREAHKIGVGWSEIGVGWPKIRVGWSSEAHKIGGASGLALSGAPRLKKQLIKGFSKRRGVLNLIARDDDHEAARPARPLRKQGLSCLCSHCNKLRIAAEREMMIMKLRAPPGPDRTEVLQLAQIFRARVVDVSDRSLTLVVSGDPGKVSQLIGDKYARGLHEPNGCVCRGRVPGDMACILLWGCEEGARVVL
eukprot:1144633-Pelagomonas_calceolata.AAC.1